jgi:cytochrome c oxidase subunit 2
MRINEKGRAIAIGVVATVMLLGMAILALIYGFLPEQRSTLASAVDGPFLYVLYTGSLLVVGVVSFSLFYMFRFRRRDSEERTEPVAPNHALEISWIVLPTILVLIAFTWGFKSFIKINVAPPNAYEIQVRAQKWFWEFEYPNGVTTSSEFAVPVDRPVKLIMTSRDVIHSFFAPEFRIKHDVIPNRYTTVWFESGEVTEGDDFIQVYCAEYCGTNHSKMGAELRVLSQADFDDWLVSQDVGDLSPVEFGEVLHVQKTCVACHSTDGAAGVGPTFQGLFGRLEHEMEDGSVVEVDENYLRESILRPQTQVSAGYAPVMPMMELSEDEVNALIEFIKTLQ